MPRSRLWGCLSSAAVESVEDSAATGERGREGAGGGVAAIRGGAALAAWGRAGSPSACMAKQARCCLLLLSLGVQQRVALTEARFAAEGEGAKAAAWVRGGPGSGAASCVQASFEDATARTL
jgi:hypothetical protein